MKKLSFLFIIVALFAIKSSAKKRTPNFIIIYTDDMGYGDLSCYGNPTIKTPELDKLAAEGAKCTQFYIAANICTPSRSALMTGSYPKMVGLQKGVLFPKSKTGINPNEELLPELLKEKGYKTALFGKWHLGHHRKFLPLQNGFDEFYGIPFSNDMSKTEQAKYGRNRYKYSLPLMNGNDTIELNPDQTKFTKTFTKKALKFIEKNKKNPFFIYLAHPMPHIPLYSSKKFKGTSRRGIYGDVLHEIDYNVGLINQKLKDLKLDDNTVIVFSSDNGPWLSYKTEGGSAGPLREGKGTTWEGGQRVPCIIKWANHIPENTIIDWPFNNMDFLPTFVALAKAKQPKNKINGHNISKNLLSPNKAPKRDPFIYYNNHTGNVEAIRIGAFKYTERDKKPQLYNIEEDISERYNLIDKLPEKAKEMKKIMLEEDQKIEATKRSVGTL